MMSLCVLKYLYPSFIPSLNNMNVVFHPECSDGGASNESFSACALQLLQEMSGRVEGMADELAAVRSRVDGLPAQLSASMGAVLAAQQETLVNKMGEVADASAAQLKAVDKANNAAKVGVVVASMKAELQDWLAVAVSAAADGAADRASEGMQEAARAQQTALFQQLSSLEAMTAKLQGSAVSRAELGEMKAELSGLITAVNDNVCAVRDKLEAMEGAFEQVRGAVDALRAEAGGHTAVLDGIVAQMQQCATTASVTELVARYSP